MNTLHVFRLLFNWSAKILICSYFEVLLELFANGIFATLLLHWSTLRNSTLKQRRLIRRCLTSQIPTLTYTTPFQRWFNYINLTATLKQPWNVCWAARNKKPFYFRMVDWIWSALKSHNIGNKDQKLSNFQKTFQTYVKLHIDVTPRSKRKSNLVAYFHKLSRNT